MNSTDIINYTIKAFDNEKYLALQRDAITDRVSKFKGGKLYLEIGGKFLYDPHAARVLPGYDPQNKVNIFKPLVDSLDVIYSLSAPALVANRQLNNKKESYSASSIKLLKDIESELSIKPKIAINLVSPDKVESEVEEIKTKLEADGYEVYLRYKIHGYPSNTDLVLSKNGFGKDDYIKTNRNLVLLLGPASNSGKMSTCLGQIYLDHINGNESGYAKLETFPIWDIPLDHPINLAYEAATADIGDFNMIDPYHEKSYGINSVNYNRDIQAFEIIEEMTKKFIDKDNYMHSYKSPTDMGVNFAGKGIIDDQACCIAGYDEILRRIEWYTEIVKRGQGDKSWIKKCESLEQNARRYLQSKQYSLTRL